MVLGKKVAIFDWEWGRNSAPREGKKMPCLALLDSSAWMFKGGYCIYALSTKISCDDPYSMEPMNYIDQGKIYSVVVMFGPYIAFNIFSVISTLLSRQLSVPGLTVFK